MINIFRALATFLFVVIALRAIDSLELDFAWYTNMGLVIGLYIIYNALDFFANETDRKKR